jgi:hypothetical protein
MTIGSSIVLIAIGAILKWAVTAHVSGVNLQTVGTILFVLGLVGLALSLLYTFMWSRREPVQETRVVHRTPPPDDRY